MFSLSALIRVVDSTGILPPLSEPGFINKLIRRFLLPEYPGFATSGRDMFVVPMQHIWRGFSFQKCTEYPMWYVWYNVLPLYMPIDFDHVGLGHLEAHPFLGHSAGVNSRDRGRLQPRVGISGYDIYHR